MKSSYVLPYFYELPTAQGRLRRIINVSSGEKTRILALSWLPVSEYGANLQTTGIDLYNGLPDGYGIGSEVGTSITNRLAYRTLYQSPAVGTESGQTVFVFPEIPSHGLLFTDDIFVVGRGDLGASAVFITYQSG